MCTGELGIVTDIDRTGDTAMVRTGETQRRASLLLRPEARVGDHVVVHTGFVLDVLTADQAAAVGNRPRPEPHRDVDGS